MVFPSSQFPLLVNFTTLMRFSSTSGFALLIKWEIPKLPPDRERWRHWGIEPSPRFPYLTPHKESTQTLKSKAHSSALSTHVCVFHRAVCDLPCKCDDPKWVPEVGLNWPTDLHVLRGLLGDGTLHRPPLYVVLFSRAALLTLRLGFRALSSLPDHGNRVISLPVSAR